MDPFCYCGDGTEDDGTLYSLSTEFSEAARVLIDTPPTKINFSLAIYYLLGHAAELALKSCLYKNGETVKSLKNIGHDLGRLVELVREKGLIKEGLATISDMAEMYKNKDFEYRKNKKITFPTQAQLLMDVQTLQRMVFDRIVDFEFTD